MSTAIVTSADINRARISDEHLLTLRGHFPDHDWDTLARYLIAQNNNVLKAKDQLNRAETWKKDHWHVKKSSCIREIDKGKAYFAGYDNDNHSVLVINGRLHDLEDRDLMEMVNMTLWWTEMAIYKLPPGKTRFTMLIDRGDCDKPLDTEYFKYLAKVFQDLHPERVHKIIVYPTGVVYYSMWNMILKWFMEEGTRNKVQPCMSLNEVREILPDNIIPKRIGGSSEFVFNSDDFEDPEWDKDDAKKRGLSTTNSPAAQKYGEDSPSGSRVRGRTRSTSNGGTGTKGEQRGRPKREASGGSAASTAVVTLSSNASLARPSSIPERGHRVSGRGNGDGTSTTSPSEWSSSTAELPYTSSQPVIRLTSPSSTAQTGLKLPPSLTAGKLQSQLSNRVPLMGRSASEMERARDQDAHRARRLQTWDEKYDKPSNHGIENGGEGSNASSSHSSQNGSKGKINAPLPLRPEDDRRNDDDDEDVWNDVSSTSGDEANLVEQNTLVNSSTKQTAAVMRSVGTGTTRLSLTHHEPEPHVVLRPSRHSATPPRRQSLEGSAHSPTRSVTFSQAKSVFVRSGSGEETDAETGAYVGTPNMPTTTPRLMHQSERFRSPPVRSGEHPGSSFSPEVHPRQRSTSGGGSRPSLQLSLPSHDDSSSSNIGDQTWHEVGSACESDDDENEAVQEEDEYDDEYEYNSYDLYDNMRTGRRIVLEQFHAMELQRTPSLFSNNSSTSATASAIVVGDNQPYLASVDKAVISSALEQAQRLSRASASSASSLFLALMDLMQQSIAAPQRIPGALATALLHLIELLYHWTVMSSGYQRLTFVAITTTVLLMGVDHGYLSARMVGGVVQFMLFVILILGYLV